MLNIWINRLKRIGNKKHLSFESVYTAIGGIDSLNDKIAYIHEFAKIDSDFTTTLRAYARREYRRTGDRNIEIEWIKALHDIEAQIEFDKHNETIKSFIRKTSEE